MKQKLLHSFVLRVCLLVAFFASAVSGAWADTKTEGFESATTSTTYNSTVNVATNKSDCGIGWTIYYGTVSTNNKISGNNSAQMRWYYSAKDNHPYIMTTTAIDNLSKVDFKARVGNTNVKMDVAYSTNGSSWTNIASAVTFSDNQATNLSYDIPSGGKYIKLGVSNSSTAPSSGNYMFIVDDVVFTYTSAAPSYTINAQSNNNTYGTVTLSGTTITATPEDGYRVSTTTPYTITSGTASVTQDGNLFSVDASSDCTITINFEEKPSVSGYTIDFENDLEDYVDWTFTNAEQAANGDNANFSANGGTHYGTTGGKASASIQTTETIALPGTFTCYVSKQTSNTTSSTWYIQVSSDGSTWTNVGSKSATSMSAGTWEEFTANLGGYSDVYVRLYYSGSTAVRNVDDISITMRDPNAKTTPTVTIDATSLTTDIAGSTNVAAGTITATVTSGENTISTPAVTWSSSNTDVATVDANTGAVTLIAVGTTTITASFAGNDDYNEASETYELTVTNSMAPGGEANPYTVAQALTAIQALPDNNATTEHYYISGIVSAFYGDATGITTSSSKRYYISDNGTTTTQLLVYNGKGLNNVAFSSDDDLLIGDRVVIYGAIQNYQGNTPEIANGNYIVSRVTKANNDIAATEAISLSMANPETTADVNNYISSSSDGALSFESNNTSIVTVDANGIVTPIAAGTTTITVNQAATATYKAGSTSVTVTVAPATKADNEILLDEISGSTAYGTPLVVDYAVETGYDGTMTYTSNPDIADVSFSDDYITFTPKAVGEADITISAPATAAFNAADDVTFTLTVTAPEGSTKAPSSETTTTFDFSQNGWGLPTSSVTLSGEYTNGTQTVTISGTGYYYGSKALLLGKSGATITLPAFDKTVTQIDVVGVEGASGSVVQNIFVGDDAVSTATTGANGVTNTYAIAQDKQAAGTIYTLKVTSSHNTQIASIVVHQHQTPSTTVSLNTSGYGTFSSVYPMDFSATEGYTAWRITSIDMDGTTGTINCEKITEAIKGGQGVLLYNKNAGGLKTNATIYFADGTKEFSDSENLLEGIMAPTYVETGDYFGLKGNEFVPVNEGTIPAGKALLPASVIPDDSGVKAFTFVFNGADGIQTVETVSAEDAKAIFNLAGQRLSKTQRGVNIVNGKKVLVK